MEVDRSEITIEKVRYRDLKDLEKIFTKEFGDEVSTGIIKQRVHRIRQFYYLLLPLSNISNWINNLFNIYVIRTGETVIGFMQVSYLAARQLHLDYIAISRKYRGRGLGTMVLQTLLKEVADRNRDDVILEVKNDNPARALYERLGFTVQAQVLHYERALRGGDASAAVTAASGPVLQKLKFSDRALLYQLYCASIPRKIQQVIRRDRSEFRPSLFMRNLHWFKNYLMRAKQQEFVVHWDGRLICLIEVRSYARSAAHMLSVMLHRSYEYLREDVLRQVLARLESQYGEGKVSTTIYDDSQAKRQVLEQLGFARQEQYYLMLRTAGSRFKEMQRVIRVKTLHFKPQRQKDFLNKKPL